jgi:hypothetical protein
VKVHAVEDRLHDFTVDIFEIDVDAFGSGGSELRLPVGMLVVDGGGEAKIVFLIQLHFPSEPAVPRRWQPWILPSWPTMLPVEPAAAETTRVSPDRALPISSSESVVAQSAEEMGVGEKGGGGNFVEGVRVFAIEEGKFLKTGETHALSSRLKSGC